MRKGDIVRKRALIDFSGLIGPYMRIEYIEENRLYCGVLNSDTPNVMLLKDRATVVSHQCLQINRKVDKSTKKCTKNH